MFSLGWVKNRLKREGREDEVEVDQTEKEDIVIPRSKPVVEQPDEQPEMDDYEEFDTEAELLEAEGKENRKTEPEYQEEEVAGDDLVVTIAKGDDDPICEKTDEINTRNQRMGRMLDSRWRLPPVMMKPTMLRPWVRMIPVWIFPVMYFLPWTY